MERHLKHDENQQRYILKIENNHEAYVSYELNGDQMKLVFSFVPNELRGQGIGKELVERTFAKLTDEGYFAVAVCSYIKKTAINSSKWKQIIK